AWVFCSIAPLPGAWPRVSAWPLPWISAPPCDFAAGDPEGMLGCSAPPAALPPSRIPCAEARPMPAISATVPSRSFLLVVRFIVNPLWFVPWNWTRRSTDQRENRCSNDYVPLFATQDCTMFFVL